MLSGERNNTAELAHFISSTRFDSLPVEVVRQAKLLILDVIGCAMSGASHDRGNISRKIAIDLGGRAEATIIGRRKKISCIWSAYANANMASSLDNEETFMNVSHFSSNTVFPALSLAERDNAPGKDLITAVAVGYESAARIGLSTGFAGKLVDNHVITYPVQGYCCWESMAGVAAACNLLRLNDDETFHALGIQGHYSPAPSSYLWTYSPNLSLIKYWDNGWMAAGGIMSALLAQQGYSSYYRGVLDGKHGFWKIYGAESCDFELMTRELGIKWWLLETSFKPWPSCRWTHHPLTAITHILKKHQFEPEDIEKVKIEGSFLWLPHFKDPAPKGPVNPQFSALHAMTMFLLQVPPGPDWYRPEILRSTRVKRFSQKVVLELNPQSAMSKVASQLSQTPRVIKKIPTTVEMYTKGGVFAESVEYAKGDPWDTKLKMSENELEDKFRLNALSLQPTSSKWIQNVEQIITMCQNLEKAKSARALTSLLSPDA